MRALYSAASGMSAQQTRLDSIANNLANVNTTGYKKSREAFQDLMYQELTRGGLSASTARTEVGGGVRLSAIEKDHSTGTITQTNNPLNVALQGRGYFVLETPDGEQVYSRDGAFTKDADGMLVTSAGLKVAGDIIVPLETQQLQITADGTVFAVLDGDTEATTLGQLQVASFVNPAGLRPIGGNLYEQAPESGEAQSVNLGTESTVMQGFLEGSNVDVAEELIGMIMSQRSYELNSKVVQAADETLRLAATLRR